MIKNRELLEKFEEVFMKEEGNLPFARSMKLFTNMWNEGVNFGILPPRDPLEGIEVDVRIAKILNSCSKKSFLK